MSIHKDIQEEDSGIAAYMQSNELPSLECDEKLVVIVQLPSGAKVKDFNIDKSGSELSIGIELHKLMWHPNAMHITVMKDRAFARESAVRKTMRLAGLVEGIKRHNQALGNDAILKCEKNIKIGLLHRVHREQGRIICSAHSYDTSEINDMQCAFVYFEMELYQEEEVQPSPGKIELGSMNRVSTSKRSGASSSRRASSSSGRASGRHRSSGRSSSSGKAISSRRRYFRSNRTLGGYGRSGEEEEDDDNRMDVDEDTDTGAGAGVGAAVDDAVDAVDDDDVDDVDDDDDDHDDHDDDDVDNKDEDDGNRREIFLRNQLEAADARLKKRDELARERNKTLQKTLSKSKNRVDQMQRCVESEHRRSRLFIDENKNLRNQLLQFKQQGDMMQNELEESNKRIAEMQKDRRSAEGGGVALSLYSNTLTEEKETPIKRKRVDVKETQPVQPAMIDDRSLASDDL